jgi:hypothetical protein
MSDSKQGQIQTLTTAVNEVAKSSTAKCVIG